MFDPSCAHGSDRVGNLNTIVSNLSSSWSGWNPSRIADESWLSQTITEASVYTVVTPMLATITGYIVLERFGTSHHEQYNGLRHCQEGSQADIVQIMMLKTPLTARFMWPTWGPSGADRTQVGPCCLHEFCYLGWSVYISVVQPGISYISKCITITNSAIYGVATRGLRVTPYEIMPVYITMVIML